MRVQHHGTAGRGLVAHAKIIFVQCPDNTILRRGGRYGRRGAAVAVHVRGLAQKVQLCGGRVYLVEVHEPMRTPDVEVVVPIRTGGKERETERDLLELIR